MIRRRENDLWEGCLVLMDPVKPYSTPAEALERDVIYSGGHQRQRWRPFACGVGRTGVFMGGWAKGAYSQTTGGFGAGAEQNGDKIGALIERRQ